MAKPSVQIGLRHPDSDLGGPIRSQIPAPELGQKSTLVQETGGRINTWYGYVYEIEHDMMSSDRKVVLKFTEMTSQPKARKEKKMPTYPQAVLVRDKSRRTVKVHLEVDQDVFLKSNGETQNREPGQEMPLFATFPEEHFIPIVRAGLAEYSDPRSPGTVIAP